MKTAVITGASSGLGREFVRQFYSVFPEIERVWLIARRTDRLQELAEQLEEKGISTLTLPLDLCDTMSFTAYQEHLVEEQPEIALLVNNAGVAVYGLLTDLDPAVWQRLFDVNVTGMYNCCRCAIPPMVHEKAGHIINLASILGTNGASCEVAYSATKGAVVAFTKALAKELGPSGIRVNCVAPGCIDTDMIANLSPEDKAELADSTSLCRMGTAEDVADAITLLASERARFVTGQVFGVDGGLLI